jgi:hypothetical protein
MWILNWIMVDGYQCFGGICYLHLLHLEGEGSRFLEDVGDHIQEYTAS